MNDLGQIRLALRRASSLKTYLASHLTNRLLFRRSVGPGAEIDNILFIKLDNAGDVVLSSLLLPAIHERFGGARIVCVVKKGLGPLLEDIDGVSRVVEVPYGVEHCSQVRREGPSDLKAAKAVMKDTIRDLCPDLIIDLRSSPLGLYAAAVGRVCGARYRATLDKRRLGEIFGRGKEDKWGRHEAETSFSALRATGVFPPGSEISDHIRFWQEGRKGGQRMRGPGAAGRTERPGGREGRRAGGGGTDKRGGSLQTAARGAGRIIVQPGAVWDFKRWPEPNFSTLLNSVSKRHPQVRFLLVGTRAEAGVSARVVEGLDRAAALRTDDLTGRTTLKELIRLIEGAELVIANDSGVAHIAGALGVPTAVFFGPSAPERFSPLSPSPETVKVFHHRMECCPCDQLRCVHPFGSHCLAWIKPREVVEHVDALLARAEPRRAGSV